MLPLRSLHNIYFLAHLFLLFSANYCYENRTYAENSRNLSRVRISELQTKQFESEKTGSIFSYCCFHSNFLALIISRSVATRNAIELLMFNLLDLIKIEKKSSAAWLPWNGTHYDACVGVRVPWTRRTISKHARFDRWNVVHVI